jgi:hypothetical protein
MPKEASDGGKTQHPINEGCVFPRADLTRAPIDFPGTKFDLRKVAVTELLWSWKTARPEWLAENIYTSEAHQTPTVTSDGSLVVPANLAGNH